MAGKMIKNWLQTGMGVVVLITALFLNRLKVSEVQPRFFPISAAVLMVDGNVKNAPALAIEEWVFRDRAGR
jgi:hypothetical protein